jgi:Protease inhibitor Inh
MASRTAALALIILTAAPLAGCWNPDRPSMESSAGAVTAPPVNLAGRWTLSSTGAGSCAMTFGAEPKAIAGTIAPAGGCPYNFFTSRKWNYTSTGLIIRDYKAQVLAQLAPSGSGGFAGKTTAGQDVTLTR